MNWHLLNSSELTGFGCSPRFLGFDGTLVYELELFRMGIRSDGIISLYSASTVELAYHCLHDSFNRQQSRCTSCALVCTPRRSQTQSPRCDCPCLTRSSPRWRLIGSRASSNDYIPIAELYLSCPPQSIRLSPPHCTALYLLLSSSLLYQDGLQLAVQVALIPSLPVDCVPLPRFPAIATTPAPIMAIHSPEPAAPAPIDIEAWTEQATAALSTITISAPGHVPLGTTTVTLQIPLDDVETRAASASHPASAAVAKEGGLYKRKEPVRRDSLRRREALLKGKEGSKRRMRWENGASPSPSSHALFSRTARAGFLTCT